MIRVGFLVLSIIFIAGVVLFTIKGITKKEVVKSPEQVLKSYMNCICQKNYSEMYEMITDESKKMISISIIIPAYNTEKYLQQCLESIANQTFTDYEAICIDDGSTDNSPTIMDAFASKDGRSMSLTRRMMDTELR